MQAKKIIRNILLFVILIFVTFVVIFKNYDLDKTIEVIKTANIGYLLLAFLCMWLYMLFEGLNIRVIVGTLGKKISILNSIKYTLIGFFFSGITPGGGGGQPMEIYYMSKDNVPGTYSTLAILIELCSFHLLTIILGIIGLLCNTNVIGNGFIWIFIIV